MLGIGEWHKAIPTKRGENAQWRLELLERCERDEELRLDVLQACREDILFFVDLFVVQFNPNSFRVIGWQRNEEGKTEFVRERDGAVGPWVSWDFQRSAILKIVMHIQRGKDLPIEKSREMGASWICLIVILWFWLFVPMSKFLLISKSAEAVHKPGDSDSLLWKWDFMVKHLPKWMIDPAGVYLARMVRVNERNGSSVTGQASTALAGVGGRATAAFIDEFSAIREDEDVYGFTSNTAACRIFNFTHRGTGKFATELCRRATDKLLMHWSQHPEKMHGLYRFNIRTRVVEVMDRTFEFPEDYKFILDGSPTGGPYPGLRSPWYDEEVMRKPNKQAVAMDLDVNPEGSVEQFFDAVMIRELLAACSGPTWQGDIEYDQDNGHFIKLVARGKGPLRLWVPIDHLGRPRKSRYFIGGDISAGSGVTPTCFPVFDGNSGEKVAQYTNAYITSTEAGLVMVALAWLFQDEHGNGAKLCWEAMGPGMKTGEKIIECGYYNVYFRTEETSLNHKVSSTPGWVPTIGRKRKLLEDYREALKHREFFNPDEDALRECGQIRYKDGEVVHDQEDCGTDSGAKASHADHVIADALAWKIAKMAGCERVVRKKKEPPPLLSLEWRRNYGEMQRKREEAEGIFR